MLWLRQDQAEILRGRLAFHEVDLTTNEGAFEYITEELGYSQVPVVVYDKDGTENHWSGLNPGGIDQIISHRSRRPRPRSVDTASLPPIRNQQSKERNPCQATPASP